MYQPVIRPSVSRGGGREIETAVRTIGTALAELKVMRLPVSSQRLHASISARKIIRMDASKMIRFLNPQSACRNIPRRAVE